MVDLSWLAREAKSIHAIFQSLFFVFAGVLLCLGVVIEYFRLPLGGTPQFPQLVGRTLIAAILLSTYPDVSNLIAEITDALAQRIGSLNEIQHVLQRFSEKVQYLTWSWTAFKDSVLMLISFATFFLLYISVFVSNAAIAYAWVLLYVFSPVLIALFILPSTAGATKTLYRSLLEVGSWKVVWAVLAALLWSTAFGQINETGSQINFITAISLNLILAGSLLLTPLVVNALVSAGIAHAANQMAGIAVGAASFNPGQIINSATKQSSGSSSWIRERGSQFVERYREARSSKGPSGKVDPDKAFGRPARTSKPVSKKRKSTKASSLEPVPSSQQRQSKPRPATQKPPEDIL